MGTPTSAESEPRSRPFIPIRNPADDAFDRLRGSLWLVEHGDTETGALSQSQLTVCVCVCDDTEPIKLSHSLPKLPTSSPLRSREMAWALAYLVLDQRRTAASYIVKVKFEVTSKREQTSYY